MRRTFTFLLLLLVGLHSTAALCLCPEEPQPVAQHSHSYEHEEEGVESSHSVEGSHQYHSHSDTHHHDKDSSCSCIQEASDLPSKLEVASLHKQLKDVNWVFSPLAHYLFHDFIFQASFQINHNLAPPGLSPLYIQKSSFLI